MAGGPSVVMKKRWMANAGRIWRESGRDFQGSPMGPRPTKVDENGGKSAVGWQSRGMAEVVTALEMLRP